jgi:hypothetical protein
MPCNYLRIKCSGKTSFANCWYLLSLFSYIHHISYLKFVVWVTVRNRASLRWFWIFKTFGQTLTPSVEQTSCKNMECFLQNNFILDALCNRILVDTFFPKVLLIWILDVPLNDTFCRTLWKNNLKRVLRAHIENSRASEDGHEVNTTEIKICKGAEACV